MERVLGIGGVFFKARDPKALAEWHWQAKSASAGVVITFNPLIAATVD
jgi:hypothetical protein